MHEKVSPKSLNDLRLDTLGIDTMVPLLDGTKQRYIFLDNAASTPTFRSVLKCIEDFLPWYSGVHRGTGFKSLIATELYDHAHDIIGNFVNADRSSNVVILVKNSTEAINKLSNRLNLSNEDVVISTIMEHHSNDLPWRKHCKVVHINVEDDGHLKIDDLKSSIKVNEGKLKLVAINGASNITGICNPIYDIARWTHEAGATIFVDAAQLAPHRAIDILPNDDPSHIDFIAFSAHKMYAPFGTGVLIGPREVFEKGEPDTVGGGVVTAVSLDEVYWSAPPDKDEAGSPNVVGAIALAKVITVLEEVGMDTITAHETELLEYAYERLKRIPKVILYGPSDNLKNKVGVITFNVEGMHNALVAAIFGAEGGIGLRNGCFCAHPYVKRLLKISPEEDRRLTIEMISGDKTNIPGLVRAYLGCYNNKEDLDRFIEMLTRIAAGKYRGEYIMNAKTGTFSVKGYKPDFERCFSFGESERRHVERFRSEAS
ncbi:MAG: aminotransferase class V-fold PLP-dependent enzyme [Ignavibacteriales bacterium]|nr:aminotransferase class V-fold PLP-dependent enzyme [Ignavibacteriales bacterium]